MKKNRILVFSLVFMLLLTLTAPAMASSSDFLVEQVEMQGETIIIHTNDSHGRAVETGQAGISTVSALKKQYEALGAEVILLDAGDTLHGLPFATLDKGASIIKLMEMAGYDAMCPGNHDFNYGFEYLLELSKSIGFKVLSANTIVKETNSPAFEGYTIIEKNDKEYGIFGLTTPETATKTNPLNVKDIVFSDPIVRAQEMVNTLENENVDYIIALVHIGVDEGSEVTSYDILEQVEGIDLMIDGHSHTVFEEGKQIENTLLVSTGQHFNNLGVVTIKEDGSMAAKLINKELIAELKDEAIEKEVTQIAAEREPMLNEVVGKMPVDLDGERETNRSSETNLGNLAADAMRWSSQADLAMTNGGGIRASIPAGQITKGQIISVFPFGNYVATKSITGQVIKDVLEYSVRLAPELNGGFMQVSGVSFSYEQNKEVGNKVSEILIGGQPLELDKNYVFATNDFLIAGGDGYEMLKDADIINEYPALEEVLISYINAHPDIMPAKENRIKKIEKPTEKVYVVMTGDFLWKIAKAEYGDASHWNKIHEANKAIIKSPHLIYVGQKIVLP